MLPTPVLGSQGWGNPWGSLAGQPGIFDELQASEQACVTKRDGQTVSVNNGQDCLLVSTCMDTPEYRPASSCTPMYLSGMFTVPVWGVGAGPMYCLGESTEFPPQPLAFTWLPCCFLCLVDHLSRNQAGLRAGRSPA